MKKLKILLLTICIMLMSTLTVSASRFTDIRDDIKDEKALQLAAGYVVAHQVQKYTKISALELFLASTAVNYMSDRDMTDAVIKSLVYQIKF